MHSFLASSCSSCPYQHGGRKHVLQLASSTDSTFCIVLLQLSLGHNFPYSCTALACQRSSITHCRFLTQSTSASWADPAWGTQSDVFIGAVELSLPWELPSLSSSFPFWGCAQQERDPCSIRSFPHRSRFLLLSVGAESESSKAVGKHVAKISIHHIFLKTSDASLSLEVCSAPTS